MTSTEGPPQSSNPLKTPNVRKPDAPPYKRERVFSTRSHAEIESGDIPDYRDFPSSEKDMAQLSPNNAWLEAKGVSLEQLPDKIQLTQGENKYERSIPLEEGMALRSIGIDSITVTQDIRNNEMNWKEAIPDQDRLNELYRIAFEEPAILVAGRLATRVTEDVPSPGQKKEDPLLGARYSDRSRIFSDSEGNPREFLVSDKKAAKLHPKTLEDYYNNSRFLDVPTGKSILEATSLDDRNKHRFLGREPGYIADSSNLVRRTRVAGKEWYIVRMPTGVPVAITPAEYQWCQEKAEEKKQASEVEEAGRSENDRLIAAFDIQELIENGDISTVESYVLNQDLNNVEAGVGLTQGDRQQLEETRLESLPDDGDLKAILEHSKGKKVMITELNDTYDPSQDDLLDVLVVIHNGLIKRADAQEQESYRDVPLCVRINFAPEMVETVRNTLKLLTDNRGDLTKEQAERLLGKFSALAAKCLEFEESNLQLDTGNIMDTSIPADLQNRFMYVEAKSPEEPS